MAFTISTYSELQSAMNDWLDDSVTTARLENFIGLAEARVNRLLRTLELEVRATATLNAEYLAVPDDFREVRAINIQSDPMRVPTYMDLGRFQQTYNQSLTGVPINYTIVDGQFRFGPIPDTSYTIEIIYMQSLPALTDANTSNWLLADHPDVYLAGALTHAQAFLRDDSNAAQWKAVWEEGLDEIEQQSRRKKSGSQPLQIRPSVNECL
jgi:hypothetical protein